jgi:hypothetical protein
MASMSENQKLANWAAKVLAEAVDDKEFSKQVQANLEKTFTNAEYIGINLASQQYLSGNADNAQQIIQIRIQS